MGWNSEVLVRRKKLIVLPDVPGVTNASIIAAANLNLQDLGFTLSASAINKLKKTDYRTSEGVLTTILKKARKAKGDNVWMRPMYPNFPAQVAQAAEAELYINAILHYFSVWVSDVTGDKDAIYLPRYYQTPRAPLHPRQDRVKLEVLNLIEDGKTAKILREVLTQLVTSNTSISETDKSDIRVLVDAGLTLDYETEIPNKENLVTYAAALIHNKDFDHINYNWFQHGTDVLRLAAAVSGADVSLAANPKFKSFTRPTRRLFMDLLAKDKNLNEALARDKERFIRLGEFLHPAEFKSPHYRSVRDTFKILRAGVSLETFNGRVEKYLADKNPVSAAHILVRRPGEFARRLDHLLTLASSYADIAKIVGLFEPVAHGISTPVLLQVRKHFLTRNQTSLRVIMPKGEVSKIQVIKDELRKPINPEAIEGIVDAINGALLTRFKKQPKLGKVYIDPALKNYLMPYSQRSASASFRTIVRGSKVPFASDKNTIRFFIHWKDGGTRTDLDLSASMYGPNWEDKGAVWYGNLRNYYGTSHTGYKAVHSGDITSAPHGAAEFVDIDIPSAIAYGARYVVMSVNQFAGPDNLSQVKECFAGWMLRAQPQSGEVFEPKTVVDKIDVTSESRMVVPMIIDLVNREIIWVDSEISGVARWGGNIRNQQSKIVTVGKAFTQLQKTNLYELLSLHTAARGKQVLDKSKADVVFDVESGIQFDQARIASEFITE